MPHVLHVQLAYSPAPRQVELMTLELPAGSTVAQALHASGLLQRHPPLQQEDSFGLAVWGRRVDASVALCDGDRIEVCRGLQVDPKESRRLRYRAQGEGGRVRARSKTSAAR